jgi:hypothetical protein
LGAQTFQSEALFSGNGVWTNSGFVGVGTRNPGTPIDIFGAQSVARLTSTGDMYGSGIELRNLSDTRTHVGFISFKDPVTDSPVGQIAYEDWDSMIFATGGYYRMGLDSSGQLGIGTTNPSYKLEVLGNVGFDNPSGNTRFYMEGKEALFSDGNYFSWGYEGTGNRFYDPVGIGGIAPGYQLHLSQNSAAKPVSSVWIVASDLRLNKDITPFTDGLAVIEKIKPISYRYNGLAGLPRDAPCIGVAAQEIKDVAPYTVGTFRAKLEEQDEAESEFYDFDSHALTFILINAVKELHAEIAALSGKEAPGGEREVVKKASVVPAKNVATQTAHIPTDPDEPKARPWAVPTPERFPVCEPVEVGDVLVADAAHPGAFCLGRQAADSGVVGIAMSSAWAPAETGDAEAAYPQVPVAMSGVVTCKVDAAYSPIAVKDLLVVSPTPGHAMRAESPAQGTVVGKALEPLDAGTGVIRVLVMLR